jgi:hypothetical protein
MQPHTVIVFKYHSGKLPLAQASAKFWGEKGPAGVSEAMSGGTPGRSDATAHSNTAPLTANIAISRQSAFMIGPAFEHPERQQCQC